MPFFSIIIPTFNRAHLIGETITSILDQQFTDFEIIIVDDGSTDNTKEVISKIDDLRIRYYFKDNGERAAARNFGTKLANGAYLNFFDSDDIFLPGRLNQFYESISKNGFPDFIYSYFKNLDSSGKEHQYYSGAPEKLKSDLVFNNFFACGSVFLNKRTALEFPFNEDRDLSSAEDWELWLRLIPFCKIVCTPIVTFIQREHVDRSLNTINWIRIKKREEKLLHYFMQNNTSFYGRHQKLFISDRHTFLAICAYELGEPRKSTLVHLLKSVSNSMFVLFRKRFWAAALKVFRL
jgi:glycosyltransferase involved in cell wall biosynthesis